MSIRDDEVVTASCDHSLKCFNITKGTRQRELYSKKFGHSEWVTTVCHVPSDGRIVSGAMDSKLCLWDARGTRCDDLLGHTASISLVKCDENNIAVSASYDASIKAWDLNRKACIQTLQDEHMAPIFTFFWRNSLVASGDKSGKICFWDINTGQCIGSSSEHRQAIMAIDFLNDPETVLLSGGMDGKVCVWDLRTSSCVCTVQAHKGSTNCMTISKPHGGPAYVVTGGSDKMCRVLDPRESFGVCMELREHKDVVTTVQCADDIVMSGAGNGWVLAHDINSGKCFYGVGASESGAVHCVELLPPKYMLTAGDDGKLIIFDYAQS